jgi:type IV secretory pathway VirB2 component (pilin)
MNMKSSISTLINKIAFAISKVTFSLLLFVCLSFSFVSATNIDVNAQAATIRDLDILGVDCPFRGAIAKDGSKCAAGNNLLDRIVDGFLIPLAVPLALIVIMWGGYQYFIGGFDGKSNGIKAIQSAVIGLIVVLMARFLVNSIFGGDGVEPILGADGAINPNGIIKFMDSIRIALVSLSGAFAAIVLVWGGYKYFFSSLDWEKEGGGKALRNGLVGLIIIFLANGVWTSVTSLATEVASSDGNGIALLGERIVTPLLTDARSFLVTIASGMAVLVIIWGGYKYFFNGIEAAKKDGLEAIRNGVIGLVAVLLANTVVSVLLTALPTTEGDAKEGSFNVNINPIVEAFRFLISNVLIPTSSAVAVFFFILGGYYWITANGEQKNYDKAKKAIQNSIIGLIVLLSSATIVQLIIFIVNGGIIG